MIPNTVIGSVPGTGAAINVVLGFKPDYVEVVNSVTGSMLRRFRGFTGLKEVVAGTVTVAAGLTDYSGPTGDGFTIPVDAQVNINGNTISYIAIRSGPGAH